MGSKLRYQETTGVVYTCKCACRCSCVYVRVYIYTYIYVCIDNIYAYIYICVCAYTCIHVCEYGVATMSRRLQIVVLFCKRALSERRYSAKKIYNFKEPTNRSHPICVYVYISSFATCMRHINNAWSHVTHMNESGDTYECVMSHRRISHGTHIQISHITHMNESCHTYEWVTSHRRISHGTYIWISHVTHIGLLLENLWLNGVQKFWPSSGGLQKWCVSCTSTHNLSKGNKWHNPTFCGSYVWN